MRWALCVTMAVMVTAGAAWSQPAFVNGAARLKLEKGDDPKAKAAEATRVAYAAMKARLGDRPAKCYLVSDNLAAADAVNEQLKALLKDAPYAGLANNWGDYLPIDRETLGEAAQKDRGIVITAVCGDIDAQIEMVDGVSKQDVSYDLPKEQWRAKWEQQRPAHAAKGAELEKKFNFIEGATNVLMVTGTMHTPRQEFVFDGVRQGAPIGAVLIGGSGADFGAVYYKGKVYANALYGLRLSGRFSAVATGSKGGAKAKTALDQHLAELTAQLKGSPTSAIYFGCAGWRNSLPEQQAILQKHLPDGVGVYGQFCGGEWGRLKGNDETVVDTDLGVIVLMGKTVQ